MPIDHRVDRIAYKLILKDSIERPTARHCQNRVNANWKGVNGRREGGRNGPKVKMVLVYVLYQVKRMKEERTSKKKLKYIAYIERA